MVRRSSSRWFDIKFEDRVDLLLPIQQKSRLELLGWINLGCGQNGESFKRLVKYVYTNVC